MHRHYLRGRRQPVHFIVNFPVNVIWRCYDKEGKKEEEKNRNKCVSKKKASKKNCNYISEKIENKIK